jgi:ABC-type transport system involved in multi-copper enzyme maturation permease subunit
MKLIAIARNTVKETIRRRSLHITLIASFVLLVGLGVLARRLMQGAQAIEDERVLLFTHFDLGIRVISLFGVLITVLIAMSAIPNEVERRTTYAVFSHPVRRYEFVLGKFLGVVFVIALNLAVMALVAFVVFASQRQNLVYVLRDIAMLGYSLASLAAIITFFSTFMGPAPAGILGFSIYELGKQPGWVNKIWEAQDLNTVLRLVAKAIFHIIPRVNWLNYEAPIIEIARREQNLGLLLVGVYIAVMLILACLIFARREL